MLLAEEAKVQILLTLVHEEVKLHLLRIWVLEEAKKLHLLLTSRVEDRRKLELLDLEAEGVMRPSLGVLEVG